MPQIPSWIKAADPASFMAEGYRIGDNERAQASEEAARGAASARADEELQQRQKALEQEATAAAQKYQAQQGYQQAVAQGMDPIQAILKFGPAMGAASSVAPAARAQQQMQPKPPSISMVPGPDGKLVPVLQGSGHVIPPSSLAAPRQPEQFKDTVRQINGQDVAGQESSRTGRFIPYPGGEQQGAVTPKKRLEIALAGKKKAGLEKTLADESQLLALAKKRAGGKTPTHDDLEAVQTDLQKQIDDLDDQMTGGGGSSDKGSDKVSKANALAEQHPDWTKQQIIDAVNGQ